MPIHPSAVIDPGVRVPESCQVGPFCAIGPGVELGEHNELISHVVMLGPTRVGSHNRFFPFAAVGTEPQDLKYKGEPTRLEIGDHNVFRESVTLHRGTASGTGLTSIGSHCLVMAYAHVAHDCVLRDHVIMANGVQLAGHVTVEEWAILGGLVAVHQFVRVGAHSYIGGGTIVTRDVLPFSMTVASREAHAYGLNSVGLKRRGFTPERISRLHHAFRVLINSRLNTSQAVDKLRSEGDPGPDVGQLLDFIASSERGIIK